MSTSCLTVSEFATKLSSAAVFNFQLHVQRIKVCCIFHHQGTYILTTTTFFMCDNLTYHIIIITLTYIYILQYRKIYNAIPINYPPFIIINYPGWDMSRTCSLLFSAQRLEDRRHPCRRGPASTRRNIAYHRVSIMSWTCPVDSGKTY